MAACTPETSLRLTVDARSLRTGLGTYTHQLLLGIASVDPSILVRAITRTQYLENVRPLCKSLKIVDAPLYGIREQIEIAQAASGADILHVPHYNAPLAYRGRLVVTIHDLTHILHETYGNSLRSRFYAQPMLRFVARRADRIITVSNYSRDRIVDLLGVESGRVSVVHCGVSPEFKPSHCGKHANNKVSQGKQPYILFVGNLKPHKNIDALLSAFRELSNSGFGIRLVVVGDDRRGRFWFKERIRELNILSSIDWRPQVDQGTLRDLYCGAELLVLPSFEEGFGLPVLEAMACGAPVVCSRAASLPEVAGDAAVYFDPHRQDELVAVLKEILGNESLRNRMRELGLVRAARFSWRTCVEEHCHIYHSLVQ